MDNIGKRIKIARKYKRLTQEELARRLGVPQQNVARWERGERVPGAKNLVKISRILDVSIDWLLTGESSFLVKDEERFLDKVKIKDIFSLLVNISINLEKEIKALITAGFTYEEALLLLALRDVKNKKLKD